MDIVDPAIDRYLQGLTASDDPILHEMEQLAAERSFPIVGPQVGRLLHLLAMAVSAKRVIELGSGFGYSAYWFAKAVGPDGLVVLTESSPEQASEAVAFLRRGGMESRVRIEIGDGLEILQRIGDEFDIVFNDVDKEQYPRVFDLAAAALRPGGLLISDNMLWYGKVLDDRPPDRPTRGVKQLTRMLFESKDFQSVLLPIRDGVTVSIYRS